MKTNKIKLSDGTSIDVPIFDKGNTSFPDMVHCGYYTNKFIPDNLIERSSRYDIEKKLKADTEEHFIGTKKQIDEALLKCKDRAKEIYERKTSDYLLIYPNRMDEFKKDLFEYFGVETNEKAEKAYELAYSKGHSDGYSEIYNEFCELVELIK